MNAVAALAITLGKETPSITGYYVGARPVPRPRSSSKRLQGVLHILKTDTGLVGVFGAYDLDEKLKRIPNLTGQRVRITWTGSKRLPNGHDMGLFAVEHDDEDRTTDFPASDTLDLIASCASHRQGQTLAVLPNGGILKYARNYDKGGAAGAWRTEYDDMVKTHDPPEKPQRYRLYLWNSGTRQHAVAADFDKVPPGFTGYADLEAYLIREVQDTGKAVVFRTPSRKVKALFVVELPPGVGMTADIAREALRALLPDKLSPLLDIPPDEGPLDHRDTALNTVFLSPSIAAAVSDKLHSLSFYAVPDSGQDNITGVILIVPTEIKPTAHQYSEYRGEIPAQLAVKLGKRKGKAKDRFLRILLASPQLTTGEGFDLPTTAIAMFLGVNQRAVHKLRSKFEQLGWLQCVGPAWKPGAKAQTFVAGGELQRVLLTLHPAYNRSIPPIPARIADGQWDAELNRLILSRRHLPLEIVLADLSKIPGFDLKDRREKAIHKWQWYQDHPARRAA